MQQNKRKKIVFFVQTPKAIGGSQIQFLDFASYIARHTEYEAYYINYPHPTVEETYVNTGIRFLNVDTCDYSQFEDAVFFTPINYLFYLLAKIENVKGARIFLYVYHPDVLNWLHVQMPFFRRSPKKLLPMYQMMLDTRSYCFMDLSNYLSMNRRVELPWEEVYLPVTIHSEKEEDHAELPALPKVDPSKPLRIGWLGRLDNDKISSVMNVAYNLMNNPNIDRVDFHLIGDGNAKPKLSIKDHSPKIRFILTSYLYGKSRDRYIQENIDLMIAMGISGIDCAMLGIPTLIPIVSPTPFWSDIFTYIYDINKYSLGWNIQDHENMGVKSVTLAEAIDDVLAGKKEELGRKGAEFCKETFSLARASEMLLEQAEQSTLTVETCLKCKPIARELKDYKLYQKVRPKRDFPAFHTFVARVNRAMERKTLKDKFKAITTIITQRKRL